MVRVKILDETGHRQVDAAPQQALEIVREEVAGGNWAFVDGVFFQSITFELLENAGEVVITRRLMGG